MKKLWDWNKVFINLEPEGQGHGIVMGVTRLLLLGPFYTIQTQTHQTFLGGVYNLKKKFVFGNKLRQGKVNIVECDKKQLISFNYPTL